MFCFLFLTSVNPSRRGKAELLSRAAIFFFFHHPVMINLAVLTVFTAY